MTERLSTMKNSILALSFLVIVLACVTDCKRRRHVVEHFEEKKVWTGQNVNLTCGDDVIDTTRRFWRKGMDVLAAANLVLTSDERYEVISNSLHMIIKNITMDDEGNYTCVVNSKSRYRKTFYLKIIELKCKLPDPPANGGIQVNSNANESTEETDATVEDNDTETEALFRFGSSIRYYCNPGFSAVGEPLRICSDPYNGGWTGPTPLCEPAFITEMRNRLGSLENKMKSPETEHKDVTKLEMKLSNIETRMTAIESENNISSRNSEKIQGLDEEINRLRQAMNNDLHHASWESALHGEIARLGSRDGHIISEYAWLVTNIYEKIEQHQADKIKYVESPKFYTHIPGYKIQIHIYPDDGKSGYMGVYCVFLQGEFDEFVTWPFTSRIQLSVLSRDENEITTDIVVPARVPACNFGRPPPNNTIGCGFSKFMSHESLKEKEKIYKYGSDIFLKVTFYLEYL